MTEDNSKEIRSKVTEEGFIEISIVKVSVPIPKEDEVLIKIEASPINPSDLGKLISFAAILDDIQATRRTTQRKARNTQYARTNNQTTQDT